MSKKTSPPMLPQIMTMIKQPNRVTGARYNYTLLQQKALLVILTSMQEFIDAQLGSKGPVQLSFFNPSDKSIELRLPLKSLAKKPTEYNELINTFESLRNVSISFPYKDANGKNYKMFTGLIEKFALPEANPNSGPDKKKYRKDIIIWLNRGLAEGLVRIDGGYTKFHLEVAMAAKCKYTPRIYQLMCRWKDKGGVTMKIEDFRQWLVLGDKHQDYKDLKKNILVPTHKELYQKADVWFEVDKVMDGKKVSHLKFKIISNESLKQADIQKDNAINMLKTHFNFTGSDIEEIRYILIKPHLIMPLYNKIIELHDYLASHTGIVDIPAYTIKTLKNAFKNKV